MSAGGKIFKKRAGTSGISGHLYETKLLSLILFKLQHSDKVTEYDLASNMDDIGAFDDICLKVKLTDMAKPLLIFVQAKHKDEDNVYLNYDLIKNFHASLLTVKKQFYVTHNEFDNIFFEGNFADTECLFILYTNARFFEDTNITKKVPGKSAPGKFHQKRQCEKDYAENLNNIISTNDSKGYHLDYNDADLEYVAKHFVEEEITTLAEHLAKFLNDNEKQTMNIMHDDYMKRYSVYLAHNFVDVSEIQSGIKKQEHETDKSKPTQSLGEDWRNLVFRPDFFDSNDNICELFRNKTYDFLIKNRGNTKKNKKTDKTTTTDTTDLDFEELISSFLAEPTAVKLSELIDTYVTIKNEKLQFLIDRPSDDIDKLAQMDISSSTIYEAQVLAAKKFLLQLTLKVPVSFGNLDMTLKGNQKKVDKRVKRLAEFIIDLCQRFEIYEPYRIVTIGEDVDEDFLSTNGGIGGAVGNLLVYDNDTKLLKFADDGRSLKNNSRALFDQLSYIPNFKSYRFNIKNINFPRLVIDCTDAAKGILDKLLIYEKQCNQSGVETLLKDEIVKYEKNNTIQKFTTNIEALFVYYHHEIQEWWMSKIGKYITKSKDVYQKAVNNILKEPQMCSLQNTFFNNMKNRIYAFNETTTNIFTSRESPSNVIIVTDVVSLMVMKIIQHLRNIDGFAHMILDLKTTINLPVKEFRALNSELSDTNKILIIVCDGIESSGLFHKRFGNISQAVEEKETIIITNKDFNTLIDLDTLMEYFSQITEPIIKENINFTDLTTESQNSLTENVKVIFQGKEKHLNSIVDEKALPFIKGEVLNKIMAGENVVIGESLSNARYEEIRHLYVNRKVSQDKTLEIYVRTFNDIEKNNVIITAEPGTGKSILLTHLSLQTQEINQDWILRINLLDYSKYFHSWELENTDINTLEIVKFLCKIVLKNRDVSLNLRKAKNNIYLVNCTGDEWATFELNIFLHFYNKGSLILIFDGFDEICPHYKDTVLNLLRTVKASPQKHRMWVASRPYNEILRHLESIAGKSYKMQYITDKEQEEYLNDIWRSRLTSGVLTDTQLSNAKSLAECISNVLTNKTFPDTMNFTFHRIYYLFYKFVDTNINNEPTVSDEPNAFWKFFTSVPDAVLEQPVASTSSAVNPVSLASKLADKLVGTPLLLYLVAEHFISLVTKKELIKEWKININLIMVYQSFIETKLKKILFEEKNKIDVYKPDVITRYEKDKEECITTHKRLAASTILKDKVFFEDCPVFEFIEMNPYKEKSDYEIDLNIIKNAKEKTGLISYITLDDVPVFIHRTFAEYFASEYLCDILTSHVEFDKKKMLFAAIYTYGGMDIRRWVYEKKEVDSELNAVLRAIKDTKPVVMSWHRELFSRGDWPVDYLLRLFSSGPDDYVVDWRERMTDDFVEVINALSPAERRENLRRFQAFVLAKMKPHLKRYFGSQIYTRGYLQMINWMDIRITLP